MIRFTNRLCASCKGACCRCIILPFKDVDSEFTKARGLELDGKERLIIAHKCPHLTEDGLCDIYENRPFSCKQLPPGCPECLRARKWIKEQNNHQPPQ